MSDLDLRTERAPERVASPGELAPGADLPTRRRRLKRWAGQTVPVFLAAAATMAFFTGLTGYRHIRVPVGADAYWYVQALRIAGQYGLALPHMLARPAYPLAATTLATAVRTTPWTTTVVFTLAMTAGLGLAGGAIIARWKTGVWGFALAVFLVGVSVTSARLLGGKSENLLNVWLLTAALAVAVWSSRRRAAAAVAGLAFGAGLAEWPFLAAFLGILAAALVLWQVLPWSPAVKARRAERASEPETARPAGSRGWFRPRTGFLDLPMLFAATAAAAVLVALVVVVWNRTGPSDAVVLTPEPAQQYLIGLRSQLSFEWPWLTTWLVLIGWYTARRFANPRVEPVRWFLTVWALVVGLTILVGFTGVALPAYRALTFDLPVALGAAGAVFLPLALATRAGVTWQRVGLRVLAGILAALAVVPAFMMWGKDFRPNTNPYQLGEIRLASQYSLGLGGRPVILVIGRSSPVATYFMQKEVVAAVGGGAAQRMIVFVGTAADVLHGQPSTWGSPVYNRFARTLFQPVLAAERQGAPILIGRALDPQEWPWAASITQRQIADDIVILRGPWPRPKTGPSTRFYPLPHWYEQALLALAMLAILWLCGAGWSRLALPDAPAGVRAAIAPALGVTAVAAVALVLARLTDHLDGWPALASLSVALAASAVAALAARRSLREATT
ncbi:MAG TPA: hypothetical protein VEQ10_06295, partial [Vicinamibacteria bacterium]|nr:hypothetical protein [Vicinamibacteria bacterium]